MKKWWKRIVDSKPITVVLLALLALVLGPEMFAMEITAVVEAIGASGFIAATWGYYRNHGVIGWLVSKLEYLFCRRHAGVVV